MEMNLENASKSCPAPSPLLSAPVSGEEEISVEENPHKIITIPERQICRICEPDDEDENGEGLVELGCQCKGDMNNMHRTCFLEWFGIRMLLQNNFNCEVCNSMLALQTQMIVAEAVGDHTNGGRRILLKGLKRHLGLKTFALTERAANHDELVQVLIAQRLEQTAEDYPSRILVYLLGFFGSVGVGAIAFTYLASMLVGGFPSIFMY